MKDLATIIVQLRALQPELKKRYPIREIGVFGSYVRGEQREDSDLHVLVDLGGGMTLIDLVRLELAIGQGLGLKVDLAMKRRAQAADRGAHPRRSRDAVTRDPILSLFRICRLVLNRCLQP